MSVITTVYNHLINYAPLTSLLATSSLDESKKAIYDEWADNYTSFPYIVTSFSFNEGGHFGKNRTTLNIDIFTEGDSIEAEEIRNQCLSVLDRVQLVDQSDGAYIRIYYDRDGVVPEPVDNVFHWNIEMSLHHWKNSQIANWND